MTVRPLPAEAAAETKATHEVLDLVRLDSVLSQLVVRLRNQGMSWQDVKAAIEAEIKRNQAATDARE